MESMLLFGICLMVIVLLFLFIISGMQLLIVHLLFKEIKKMSNLREEIEKKEEIRFEEKEFSKKILEKMECFYNMLSKQLQQVISEDRMKNNFEEHAKEKETTTKKTREWGMEFEKGATIYESKKYEMQNVLAANVPNTTSKNASQIYKKIFSELNKAIANNTYAIYVNEWKRVGMGDGRRELAQDDKIAYGAGNVLVKRVDNEHYLAVPGRFQWQGADLLKDAMKECYSIKTEIEPGNNYRMVRIGDCCILRKKGDGFLVERKGWVEIILK